MIDQDKLRKALQEIESLAAFALGHSRPLDEVAAELEAQVAGSTPAVVEDLQYLRRAAAAWEAVVKHQMTVGWELTEWSAVVAQPPLVGVGPTPIEAVEALATKLKELEGK